MSKRKHWKVLRTKQASSRDAIINVRNQGFEYFHPLYRDIPIRGVRRVTPLFPYYLLVQVNPRKNDPRVLGSTKGVQYVLGNAADEVVEEFKRATNDTPDGYYVDPRTAPPTFKPGDYVEALRGLFAEKFGVYVGYAGNRAARAIVRFEILGREIEHEVSAYDLQATSVPALA